MSANLEGGREEGLGGAAGIVRLTEGGAPVRMTRSAVWHMDQRTCMRVGWMGGCMGGEGEPEVTL